MTGKTLRQLFNALNQWNNVEECIAKEYVDNSVKFNIYINDNKIYTGNSYMEFYNLIKEEYVEEFLSEILNIIFCGNNKAEFECRGHKHIVEIYIEW